MNLYGDHGRQGSTQRQGLCTYSGVATVRCLTVPQE